MILQLHGCLIAIGGSHNNSAFVRSFSAISTSGVSTMRHGLASEVDMLLDNNLGKLGRCALRMTESVHRRFNLEMMASCDHLALLIGRDHAIKIDSGTDHLALAGSEPLHHLGSD
jgi:hypothetical protein